MTTAAQIMEPRELIARCKWCVKRIGKERFRFFGAWHDGLCVPISSAYDFTDGICTECLALEKFKIVSLRNVSPSLEKVA